MSETPVPSDSAEQLVLNAYQRLVLSKDPGIHRLRRGTCLMDAMLEPTFHRAKQSLHAAGMFFVSDDNLACALMLLPLLKPNKDSLGTALKNGKHPFSPMRFNQMLAVDSQEELFKHLQRALRFVEGRVSAYDLLRVVFGWTEHHVDATRKRLLSQYYRVAIPA